jgi:2-amino-4-hydroxy-6-hydroxymethyldihydropteridine diphosphokinase
MKRIFLGLGTNLGDREQNLVTAKDLLMKNGIVVIGQSTVLETEPLYGLDQPKYLNQVIEIDTDLKPMYLLLVCKNIERKMGRPMQYKEHASRIIDIDILIYGDAVVDEGPALKIPHPRIKERDFVLKGLIELAPELALAS